MKNADKSKVKANKKSTKKCSSKFPAASTLLEVSMDEYAKDGPVSISCFSAMGTAPSADGLWYSVPNTPQRLLQISSPRDVSSEKLPWSIPGLPETPFTTWEMVTAAASPEPKGRMSPVSASQMGCPRPPKLPVSGS